MNCALLSAFLGACLQLPVPDSNSATEPSTSQSKTEVIVLGMIHGKHRDSKQWGLEQVRQSIRNIKPDVVLCEIPPNRWPAAAKLWREKKLIEDDRIKRFPEYTDVLLPLMDELKFQVEPCAAWTSTMATARGKVISAFENAEYDAANVWVDTWAKNHAMNEADPMVIHSAHYDHATKGSLLAYDHWLDKLIGEGGWTGINQGHYDLIDAAIKRHAGKRILITFGAGHRYWFLEQLRWRDDVKLIDARAFLPSGKTPPPMEQQVVEEVFLFAECVWRCFYDDGYKYMRPAMERISKSMTPRDDMMFINGLRRGTQGSTYLDWEWLSPVVVEKMEDGQWKISFTISRAMDESGQAKKATATLIEDNSRPGGFRWTEINWPR